MKNIYSKELKIGAVTIFCAIVLFIGIDYLKGVNVFKPDNYYYIKYKEVSGLTVSSPVTLNGFKVGLVREIAYDYNNTGNLIVEISVDKKLKLPTGSKAMLVKGIMGEADIALELNNHVSQIAAVGDTLQGEISAGILGSVTNNLLPSVESMLPKIDSILSGIDRIVNHAGLHQSFQNVNSITSELRSATASLTKLMNNDMPVIVGNLKATTSNFSDISENIRNMQLNETVESANKTLANINALTEKLNTKEGTLGMLLNDDQLYKNLNSTVTSADSLLIDLKAHPKRYVHFSIW